jgi:hypothetical protein
MGRLSNIKAETSPFLNKEFLANKATVFTIVDVTAVDPKDENDKGYWKVTVCLDNSTDEKFLSLGHGNRDLFMLGIQDSIATEGPIGGCILVQRKVGMFKVFELTEKDDNPF